MQELIFFYDAFLVDVTSEERMNRISARGFAMGYIGSTIPFILSIALIILAQKGVLPLSVTIASQAAFAITALWWGLFTIPMLKKCGTASLYRARAKSNYK
ncbi:hypothetical protein GCM10020331_014460 [Ectobacillus funiculus]